jgi:hypothetical protein
MIAIGNIEKAGLASLLHHRCQFRKSRSPDVELVAKIRTEFEQSHA